MREGDSKLFKDTQLLCNMLTFRVQGWALTSLSMLYACDRTSIGSQCLKYEAFPISEVYSMERITNGVLPLIFKVDTRKWREIEGERICIGKSYEEYLKEARERISPYKKTLEMA